MVAALGSRRAEDGCVKDRPLSRPLAARVDLRHGVGEDVRDRGYELPGKAPLVNEGSSH